MRIRVVIADDQPLMRAGFKTVLEATGTIEVVGEAGDGEQAIRVADAVEPDVVLMDIQMPRLDGIEVTRRMPRRKVLILTTFDEDEYVAAALRAGVSGFLLKVAPPEDLVVAVRTVAAGQGLLDPAVTLRVIESFAAAPAPDPVRAGALAQLTDRETDVLSLLAAGLTNAEIARRIVRSEKTVDHHISAILRKLDVRSRGEAAASAGRLGLIPDRRGGTTQPPA